MPRKPLHQITEDASAQDTRERLLTAAAAEFLEHGFRAAKIASICRRAKLANGTFYVHFRTKEELYQQLIMRAAGELAVRLKVAHQADLDARSLDRMEVSIIVNFAEEREDLFKLVWSERGAYSIAHEAFAQQLFRQRSAVIAEGQSKGMFRGELDPALAAVADMGLTGEMVEWWLADRSRCTKEELITQLADMRARVFFP
jgi:AcrR family transcriptional regulator